MIIFASYRFLWLLLLVPLFFVAQALVLYFRRRRMARFVSKDMSGELMPSYSVGKCWLKTTLFAIGFAFFCNRTGQAADWCEAH